VADSDPAQSRFGALHGTGGPAPAATSAWVRPDSTRAARRWQRHRPVLAVGDGPGRWARRRTAGFVVGGQVAGSSPEVVRK
jgi:hypothetical protein